MPATANQIPLSPELTRLLGQIGAPQQGAISGAYGRYGRQLTADARPGGSSIMAPGSYASGRLATGENLSQGNLRSGLEGVLGNEGYSDWKSNRDFQQNYQLAKMSGELMKPSTLEQVLGGLGAGTQTGGQFMGLYNSLKKPRASRGYPSYAANDFSDMG